ncbi:DUF3613 domain-containing protein [Pseudomonas salmasensis]|uniref:DUF3613 domain-containing protein n=1 Tax=Pseudomonas salmasensis TaxID=2745514 RepID=UPI00321B96D7
MKFHYLAGLACPALPLLASAIEAGPSSPRQAETENWMALQLSGRAASANPQKTTPAEREQALKRWLDSNKHPIPEFFDQKVGGTAQGSK